MTCEPSKGVTISVPYGNDKTWAIRATNPDGTSKDMTGYTLVITVYEGGNSDVYTFQKTVEFATPTAPIKGYLTLTAEDLTHPYGKYRYDKALFKDGLKQSSEIGDFIINQVINTDTAIPS